MMPGQSNPPRPDGPNDGDDRLGPAADRQRLDELAEQVDRAESSTLDDSATVLAAGLSGPTGEAMWPCDDEGRPVERVVAVHDPIASLTTLLAKLNALRMELREPGPGLIFDAHAVARDQIAHRLDEIIGGSGDVWPTGARFADVRIIRDGERFELTLNGVPFPFALNSAEPVTVVQAAGAISTVSLPVLAQSVLVDDRTEQYVAQIGDAVPPVLIEHPFASARADAEPDTADSRDEPTDPTVDAAPPLTPEQRDRLAAICLAATLRPKWSAPLSMPAPDDDDPRDL